MTLLERSVNRDIGNLSFPEKKPVYAASQFEITKKVAAENEQWDLSRIAARQAWMASQLLPSGASPSCRDVAPAFRPAVGR